MISLGSQCFVSTRLAEARDTLIALDVAPSGVASFASCEGGLAQGCTLLSPAMKRSNSATGISKWRSARFGLIRPRSIKRRSVMIDTPPT